MKVFKLNKCRICNSKKLKVIFNIGSQVLATHFPKPSEKDGKKIPLQLVKCSICELVQLRHTVEANAMYTNFYGYRSGINATMRNHLKGIVGSISKKYKINYGNTVLDIGCNDGTLLKSYPKKKLNLIGIDPTAKRFKKYHINLKNKKISSNYFTANNFFKISKFKANYVTSISMFYDIPDPNLFIKDIKKVLHKNGVWVLEQSYLPTMLKKNSFDTICHEHLEYYCFRQIEDLAKKNDLKILDVFFNDINGGSFQIHVSHKTSIQKVNQKNILKIKKNEKKLKIEKEFRKMKKNITLIKKNLLKKLKIIKKKNKQVFIYGASTKGNTLLQYFKIDNKLITAAAERNLEKINLETPGTRIPIISEKKMRDLNPDFLLVLPWHFKNEFMKREKKFLRKTKFIFPLPRLEVV